MAALRLATCVFLLVKKESSLSFEPFLKDISFRESLFSPTWMLVQNNKGSVNVFMHGSRRTAIKFLLKRNDIANDIEQR